MGLGEGEAALLHDMLPPVTKELLGVLIGGDHDGTGGHDLGKARHQAGEETPHTLLPVDVLQHLPR